MTTNSPARPRATRLLRGVAGGLALAWVLPALIFNVDWTGHGSWQTNTAAVLMILGSALFIEGAVRFRSLVMSPLCIVAALFLVYVNTKQATRTLSLASEGVSEAKLEKIARGSQVASHRSQLEKRRAVQVQLAGELAVAALEADLQVVQNSDPRRWAATSQCSDVTAKDSGTFCAKVAGAQAKVAAAKARDKIDADLAALPPPSVVEVAGDKREQVADAYVANVVALLKEAGFKPTERLVQAEEAMARALGFELLAALGPSCWLAFVNMLLAGGAHMSAAASKLRSKKPRKAETPTVAAKATLAPNAADTIDRIFADELEDGAGSLKSGEIRSIVKAWCESHKAEMPDENELWARMRTRWKHDPNNGRPRYLGVKRRMKGPTLVVNNTDRVVS